jgi:predicted amidohydrolase YtcJ
VASPPCLRSYDQSEFAGKNIHCIGDRANRVVLDTFEELIEGGHDKANGNENVTLWRPRIEHAQIMTAQDIPRVGRLGGMIAVSSYVND